MNKNSRYTRQKTKTFSLHDLPRSERPRERLIEYGPKSLSSTELIALILSTGTKGESVIVTAQKLILSFGSLRGIMEASLEDLKQLKGLGEAKATKLMAAFEIARRINIEDHQRDKLHINSNKRNKIVTSPEELFNMIRFQISNFTKEHFYVISLDTRNKFIGLDEISVGTLTSSLVHPRETFESAIRRHAAQIIIAHNHPSEELDPSEDDIKITKRLVEAGRIMGIEVLDHLIFSKKGFLSFKEKFLI